METKAAIDMNETMLEEIEIQHHHYGIYDFAIMVFRKIGMDKIFDEMLFNNLGSDPDIPYSIVGMIFIANLICAQQPLYKIKDFFIERGDFDFVGTFGREIDLEKLTDDRFAYFLDRLSEVGIRKVFSRITMQSIKTFGIAPGDINLDTTSKVMWGEYSEKDAEAEGGTEFQITYGHSKQKRADKKQLKVGLATSKTVIFDAHVLSGNHDDKNYSLERISELKEGCEELKKYLGFDGFLIADAAANGEECFQMANTNGLKLLTRLGDNLIVSKNLTNEFLARREEGKTVFIKTSKKKQTSEYQVFGGRGNHKNIELNLCAVYSHELCHKKKATVEKQFLKEKGKLEKLVEAENKKKPYACKKDASEALKRAVKTAGHPNYHDVSVEIEGFEAQKAGRPRKDGITPTATKYRLIVSLMEKEDIDELKTEKIDRECVFVLASNDFDITGEEMLEKYRSQNEVEVRFKQLKSSHFMNALFLKKPKRIECLMYLYLIVLQVCTVVERVVREGLEEEDEGIREISTGLIKKKPTFRTIFEVFRLATREKRSFRGHEKRYFTGKINDDHKKILRYLDINAEPLFG